MVPNSKIMTVCRIQRIPNRAYFFYSKRRNPRKRKLHRSMMAGKLRVFLFLLAVALSLTSHSSSHNFTLDDDPIDSDVLGAILVSRIFLIFSYLFVFFFEQGVEDLLHGSMMAGKFIVFLFLALAPTSHLQFHNFSVDVTIDSGVLGAILVLPIFLIFSYLFVFFFEQGVEDLLYGSIMAGKFIIFLFLLTVALAPTSHSSFDNFSVDVTIDSGVLGAILVLRIFLIFSYFFVFFFEQGVEDLYDEEDYSLPTTHQQIAVLSSEVDIQDENAGGDFTSVSLTSSSCLSKQGDKDFATWPHRNVEDHIGIDCKSARGSSQQTSGSLELGISASYNPKVGSDAVFEVNSVKKLDPRESDALALNQSSECCILVKPKQLKFDEMDGCNSNKGSSLLSRIRELLGNPSMDMDSASLKDDKSSEQQLKSAMIRSHEDFDACTSTETMNIDLDLDLNPLVEESLLPKNRMVNPKVSLHDAAAAVYCEAAFTEVERAASESDQTSNGDVEDFYYEDMDISTSTDYEDMDISTSIDYEDMDISTSTDYDSVTIADYSYPTQQQTDDSLPPFNTWQTKHFCSSPVDLGNLWDRSTSTTENPLTSFLPHPQKQAAAVWPGRRGDIKVKALVAAKAAKIRQEKQENERNWKKEAFRMEIARRKKRKKQKEGKEKKSRRKWFLEA
uniref:Uncharacterized protein n=2 Tax=Lactuca sativa TaxID=4236 RepID=A0A9R1UDC2_LACSA|nr:hypothetical protein LSAT_V11C900491890 [Lactuca sativa]